ncbi:MAG: DUF721 domain-containing protein [Deltaproteobacteria bacterium]|nr:DUF721 domain-containing protein [Candidatus Anaeroferrophillacea bacterium]
MIHVVDNRRGGAPQPVENILGLVVQRYRLRKGFQEQRQFDCWAAAVGTRIAQVCQPLHIRRQTLHLKVSSSAWMHQLYYLQDEILNRFNAASGCRPPVTNVHFTLGTIAEPAVSPAAVAAAKKPLPPDLHAVDEAAKRRLREEIVAVVTDPELVEIIYAARLRELAARPAGEADG